MPALVMQIDKPDSMVGVEALQLLAEEGDVEAMNRLGMNAWDKHGADSKEAAQ